jgi:hypothetical protein
MSQGFVALNGCQLARVAYNIQRDRMGFGGIRREFLNKTTLSQFDEFLKFSL